jgi:glycosyltransferase involved in cell wall biosynthesis
LGIPIHDIVLPNGIDVARLRQTETQRHEAFTVLAFGGRNIQKRIDLLMQAADELNHEGCKLRVLLTNGVDTMQVVSSVYSEMPSWLCVLEQTDDINSLFAQADCFVSTSVFETFSFAIAEASIYGLPVVQSDIAGTLWNARNPSTFLFQSGNVSDLKRALLEVMQTPLAELRKNCEVSRNVNVREYSLSAWCDKILSFIKKL